MELFELVLLLLACVAVSSVLDQIRRLRAEGRISEHDTRILREEVYLMQTSLME